MAADKKSCRRRQIIICITVLVILLIGVFVFLLLEAHAPVTPKTLNKTPVPTTFPRSMTSVHPSERVFVDSVGLTSHIWQHRQGFEQNSHIQMLHKVQSRLNLSACWLCTRLPQAAGRGLMTYAEPLPLNTSAYAFFWMLFSHTSLEVEKNPTPFLFDYLVLAPKNIPVWYALGSVKAADLLSNNLDTLPYHDLITVSKMSKLDHRAPAEDDCINTCPIPIATHVIKKPSMCISRNGTMFMGASTGCYVTIPIEKFEQHVFTGGSIFYIGRSVYFLCGVNAYLWLPVDWGGTCNLVLLLPDVLPVQTKHLYRLRQMKRQKRYVQWSDVAKGMFPWYGVITNSHAIRQLSTLFEEAVNSTATALEAINLEMRAIRLVALQNRMGLDLLFVKEGGLCEKIGISCCSYIPETSSTVLQSINQLHEIRVNLSSLVTSSGDWNIGSWFSQSWSRWGWKLLAGACGILVPIVLICVGIRFLPALVLKCFSSRKSTPSSRMMVTKHIGALIHVAGHGFLPQTRNSAPELEMRHLYTSALLNKSQPVTASDSEYQPDARVYTLKPSVYENVSKIQQG